MVVFTPHLHEKWLSCGGKYPAIELQFAYLDFTLPTLQPPGFLLHRTDSMLLYFACTPLSILSLLTHLLLYKHPPPFHIVLPQALVAIPTAFFQSRHQPAWISLESTSSTAIGTISLQQIHFSKLSRHRGLIESTTERLIHTTLCKHNRHWSISKAPLQSSALNTYHPVHHFLHPRHHQ